MLAVLLGGLAAICCTPVEAPAPEQDGEDEISVGVDVTIVSSERTRSVVSARDYGWVDMTVWQFLEDGTLYRSYYSDSPGAPFSVKGRLGVTYSFCAVLNMGDRRQDVSSAQDLSAVTFTAGSMADLTESTGLPMSSALQRVSFLDSGLRFSLEFVRLVSKFNFSLSTSGFKKGSFDPVSVRILQASRSVCPFVRGNMAGQSSDVFDGDYASDEDLSTLRRGGGIVLYALENCQGTLLPGNTSPKAKVPGSIPGKEGLCTYLELVGNFEASDGTMTSVNTYRMYLGEDNCTNFDVTRNTVHNLSLSLSDWGDVPNYWKAERVVHRVPVVVDVTITVEDVEVGSSYQATAVARYDDGSTDTDPTHFSWSCEGPVSVDASGVVTGTGSGNYTVTAEHRVSSRLATGAARSQAFAFYEFDFGGIYDIEALEEELEDAGPLQYEDGWLEVTVSDDFGNSVSCTCAFTLGFLRSGNSVHYVSFEPGESRAGYGKLVDGGYVLQSARSSRGTAFLAPGSDVPIYISGGGSLVSEEVGVRFR